MPGDVEGERTTFWDKAESLVRKALGDFITYASNGGRYQRQLFVEDAEQGLGFVDLCRQRYDVVLMNPPFGEVASTAKTYCDKAHLLTKADIGFSFVERGIACLRLGWTNRSHYIPSSDR